MSPRIDAALTALVTTPKTAALRIPTRGTPPALAHIGRGAPRRPPGSISFGGNLSAMRAPQGGGGGAATLSAPRPGGGLGKTMRGIGDNAQALAGGLWRSIPMKRALIPGALGSAGLMKLLQGLQGRAETSPTLRR